MGKGVLLRCREWRLQSEPTQAHGMMGPREWLRTRGIRVLLVTLRKGRDTCWMVTAAVQVMRIKVMAGDRAAQK